MENLEILKTIAKNELFRMIKILPNNDNLSYDSIKTLIELIKVNFNKNYSDILNDYLLGLVYKNEESECEIQYDIGDKNIKELKQIPNPTSIPKYISGDSLIKKWDPVLKSKLGKELIGSEYLHMAFLLETQFNVNKGYLPESELIYSDSVELQNHALPIIRDINTYSSLVNKDIITEIFNHTSIFLRKVHVKKLKTVNDINNLKIQYISDVSIEERSICEQTFDEFKSLIKKEVEKTIRLTSDIFIGRLILRLHESEKNTFYVRFETYNTKK